MSETAARSDLMALAAQWADYFDDAPDTHAAVAINVPSQRREIVAALRLAASQPDREALASAICDGMSRGNIQWDDAGPTLRADCLATADYIIDSLLSGAGTKSDGGEPMPERTQARLAGLDDGLGPMQATPQAADDCAAPSGPSPGPDGQIKGWLEWHRKHRDKEHLTTGGNTSIMSLPVPFWPNHAQFENWIALLEGSSRALSALTRPLGGFVQGSIARKQSTDPEGSSRTETAGGEG